jgi:hypothetical protein
MPPASERRSTAGAYKMLQSDSARRNIAKDGRTATLRSAGSGHVSDSGLLSLVGRGHDQAQQGAAL